MMLWRANRLRGEVHIVRGVEAGLQDASDTSAVVTTSIVNRMSQHRISKRLCGAQ